MSRTNKIYPDDTVMRSFKISKEFYEWLVNRAHSNRRTPTQEMFVLTEKIRLRKYKLVSERLREEDI